MDATKFRMQESKFMVKIHIVANDSPLSEESSLAPLCGIPISEPVRVWTLAGDLRRSNVSTLGSCSKCRERLSAISKKRMWLCGVGDRSEIRRHSEEESKEENDTGVFWQVSTYEKAGGFSPVTRRHG